MNRRHPFLPFAAVAASTLITTSSSEAAAPRVVLIAPAPDDSFLGEALVRLTKELASVGFDVTTDTSPGHDPRLELEHAGAPDTLITITLRRSDTVGEVDAWVLDRVSGKTLVRRIHVELGSPDAPTVLAIRTTELLRASLLEVTTEGVAPVSAAPKPPPPPVVVHWMEPPPREAFAGPSASIGATLIVDPGLPVAILPTLRVTEGVGGGFAVRLTGASTVTSSVVAAAAGRASIEQQLGQLELLFSVFRHSRLVPFASLGGGVFRVNVAGDGTAPNYVGVRSHSDAFAATAGLGITVRLVDRIRLVVDAASLVVLPTERVHIGDATVGNIGAPSWMGGAHLSFDIGPR